MVYALGLKKELGQYPEERFLDGDPTSIEILDKSPGPGFSAINNTRSQYLQGRRVGKSNVPTKWLWASQRPLPDYYTPAGFPCVSPRMKTIIEEFEPDAHQFFRIKVVEEAGEQIAERFLWVVCNLVDSVDREHTTFKLMHGRTWTSNYLENGERVRIPNASLVYSAKQTESYHFWRDGHLRGGAIYASDAAGKALLDAGLIGLVGSRQETV
jgi:hypothetical protein